MGQAGQEGPVGARKGQESPGLTHFGQRRLRISKGMGPIS